MSRKSVCLFAQFIEVKVRGKYGVLISKITSKALILVTLSIIKNTYEREIWMGLPYDNDDTYN